MHLGGIGQHSDDETMMLAAFRKTGYERHLAIW
jgi:hypothetical protein